MRANIRKNIIFENEFRELLLADLALTVAFSLVILGGAPGAMRNLVVLLYLIPITFISVSLTFITHELMHKFVAQRFGAIAAFKSSYNGLMITLLSGFFGFLVGIPGATVIYTDNFTQKEEAYVSLAGPLTNFAIFLIFFILGNVLYPRFLSQVTTTFSPELILYNGYIQNAINLVLYTSILLAFFNMLPIYPLDGSKVYRWNKLVYFATIGVIFLLFGTILPMGAILAGMVFMLIFALILSAVYRSVIF